MLALSRPPDCSSPLPSRTLSPRPNSRATSARVVMLTMAARNLASSPSDLSGKARYTRSVTTSPSTASPRNSNRSFVVGTLCSNANDRCVNAASLRALCLNLMPRAFSSGVCFRGTRIGRSFTPLRGPDGPRSSRSSRRRDAAVWAGGTADTPRTSAAWISTGTDAGWSATWPSSFSAWAWLLIAPFPRRVRSIVFELQVQKRGPPGVHFRRARALPQVAVAAAPRAEAPAVRPAQGGEGHRQHHRVADHRLEVQASLNSERIPFLTGDHV